MKCDSCGIRRSTITIRETINSQIRTYHLCEVCAAERGEQFTGMMPKISFGAIFPAGALPNFSVLAKPSPVTAKEKLEGEIIALLSKERDAVEEEKYQEAAKLRDKIEILKSDHRKELYKQKSAQN